MNARKHLVVGNWKMNGSLAANDLLLSAVVSALDAGVLSGADVAVCPPYPYLAQAAGRLAGSAIAWGAQDVAEQEGGAFTGEVSAAMLADLGCTWAIVGHSERRTLMGESDEAVARKAARALSGGLGVIVCVGETLQEREQGDTEAVLARQVAALHGLASLAAPQRFVLAYEPVWAIGTGRTASPEQAQAVHAFLRKRLAHEGIARADGVRILYGGSVKGSNAVSLFSMQDIDGGLIGGAALLADDFVTIVRAAAHA